MNFPSELSFASFLQYSPRESGTRGAQSKRVMYAIKNDGSLNFRNTSGETVQRNAIDAFASAIARVCHSDSFLASYFGPDSVLIPVPKSAPLKNSGALWVPKRICVALVAQKLASDVATVLERHTPVQKSSTAGKGQRPNPPDHYSSSRIADNASFVLGRRIVLVDDVITRGSSFVGFYPHLMEAFPQAQILCFALLRTESSLPVDIIVAPVQGVIRYKNGHLSRVP